MPTQVLVPVRDPIRAQSYKTQRGDSPEDLWQPLYDRVNVATTVPSSLGFFSTPQGQSATLIAATGTGTIVKGYRDTNMQNANVVPTKLFKFVGISIGFVQVPTGAATITHEYDRELVIQGGFMQFKIVDKDILYAPLINLPILNPIASTTSTATNAWNPGGGQGNVMYKLPIPITLNPYENFQVNLNWPSSTTLTTTLDLYVFLHGFMRRPT